MSDSPKPRRPIARHGRLRSPHPVAQLLRLLSVAVAVVLVSAIGVGAFTVWDTARAIGDSVVVLPSAKPIPPDIGEIEGGMNLLLVGSDSCEGQSIALFPRCAAKDAPGERNDVTMLIHISDKPRRVTVVSFPRDMLVSIPSCPNGKGGHYSAMSSQMLNASYGYGGLACTAMTIEKLTGVQIQGAAAIRWTGVINMSDAIGGVDVCVTGTINDGNTGLHLKAGEYSLKGVEALQFLRIRHGIGDGSDLGRISNQQQFMSSMVRKLQSENVLSNPGTLFRFATTAMAQVQQKQLVLTDTIANPTVMVQIALALKSVPFNDVVFVQYPTRYAAGDGASRVLPVTGAASALFDALAQNKAIRLTGQASQGYSQQVKGEVAPTPTVAPTVGPSPSGSVAPAPSPTVDATVALPSEISGTTAAQVTCTVPQR